MVVVGLRASVFAGRSIGAHYMAELIGLEQLLRHPTDLNLHHIEGLDILRVFHEHEE